MYMYIYIFIRKRYARRRLFDLKNELTLPKSAAFLFFSGDKTALSSVYIDGGVRPSLRDGEKNPRFRVGKLKTGMPQLKRVPPSHHLNQNVTRSKIDSCHTDKNRVVFTELQASRSHTDKNRHTVTSNLALQTEHEQGQQKIVKRGSLLGCLF